MKKSITSKYYFLQDGLKLLKSISYQNFSWGIDNEDMDGKVTK